MCTNWLVSELITMARLSELACSASEWSWWEFYRLIVVLRAVAFLKIFTLSCTSANTLSRRVSLKKIQYIKGIRFIWCIHLEDTIRGNIDFTSAFLYASTSSLCLSSSATGTKWIRSCVTPILNSAKFFTRSWLNTTSVFWHRTQKVLPAS